MHFVIVFIQGLPKNEDAEAGRSGNETSPLIEKPREVQLGEQMLQLDSCLDNWMGQIGLASGMRLSGNHLKAM